MNETIDTIAALVITALLIYAGGYTILEIHDAIRKECLQQVSKGLSSSEELANALTGETLGF